MRLAAEVTKTENLFETLANKSPVGLYIVQDGKFCYANATFQIVTGYREDELLGRDSLELVVPEDRKIVRENAIRMLKGELTLPYQFRLTHKDDSIKWIMESVVSIQYRGRRAVLGSFINITEHKQAGQALRDSEERYRLLAENAEDVIWTVDIACPTRLTYISPSVARLLGYSVEEIMAKEMEVIFTRASYSSAMKVFEEEIARETKERAAQHRSRRLELQLRHKNGSLVDVEVNYSLIRGVDGQKNEILAVARDITERKQAENQLEESREKYSTLVEKGNDAIVIIQDGLLAFANSWTADITGLPQEELVGRPFLDFLSPAYRPLAAERYSRRIAGEKVPDRYEIEVLSKDGRSVPVEISATAIEYEGRPADMAVIRDITERKQAEDALRESEERYRELANSITDVFFAMDEHLRYTYWNTASEILTGIRAEDATGKPLAKIFPDTPERRRAERVYRDVLRTQRSQTFVTDYIDRDGRQYTFEISTYPSRGGISVFARDITERRQAEEAQREAEEEKSAFLEEAPIAIINADLKGRITYVNRRFESESGYSREEIIGKNGFRLDWLPAGTMRHLAKRTAAILKGKPANHWESQFKCKDGQWICVEIEGKVLRRAGAPVGFQIIARNITERKQAEEALKLAAEEWRKTFDFISDAISIHDRDHRILRANKAFAELFHMKPHQIVGKYCYELHNGAKPIPGCPHKQTLATKQPAAAEFYESRLGKYIRESTSPIFNEKHNVVGTVHITRDITEQKQQNERLMMADRLASIGELAAGTAHELNNPLTGIMGFAQLLMEKDTPDYIRKDLAFIYSEAQRAANVTSNLLTFARKHTPVKRLNQMNNIVEDVLKLRAYGHKSNRIEVERHLAPDLPEILVDYFQMQQVFLNIVINAEYFMTEAHKKGTLTITSRKQNGNVRISFADDGPGIPPENLGRIFDPFFTTKEAGKGTGLGLSICHGIVAGHGGQLYAKSQPGKGTTIFVELPINGTDDVESVS